MLRNHKTMCVVRFSWLLKVSSINQPVNERYLMQIENINKRQNKEYIKKKHPTQISIITAATDQLMLNNESTYKRRKLLI